MPKNDACSAFRLLLDPERRDEWVDCMTEVIEQEVGLPWAERGDDSVGIRGVVSGEARRGAPRAADLLGGLGCGLEPLCVDVRGGLADVFVSHEEVLSVGCSTSSTVV